MLNIRKHRQFKGVTQGEAAKALGISRPTYNQKERNPGDFTLAEWGILAKLLDFDEGAVPEIPKRETCPTCNGKGVVET